MIDNEKSGLRSLAHREVEFRMSLGEDITSILAAVNNEHNNREYSDPFEAARADALLDVLTARIATLYMEEHGWEYTKDGLFDKKDWALDNDRAWVKGNEEKSEDGANEEHERDTTVAFQIHAKEFEARSQRVNLLIKPSVVAAAKKKCEELGVSLNECINQLLEDFVK